jgi:hypothetical protein
VSDVREELGRVCLDTGYTVQNESAAKALVDAILERFDVTPKPVVTLEELGAMVSKSALGDGELMMARRMIDLLFMAGLKIVRVDE